MNLALFDFDGTLTNRDSLLEFIKYAVGKPAYYWGMTWLSPILLAYLAGWVRNDVAKQKLMAHHFAGWSVDRYQQTARDFSLVQINQIIREEAINKLDWHLQQGDRVIVVSAAMEDWVAPWCKHKGIELLATRMASEEGKLTGGFATPNCFGEEKVNRIMALVDTSSFDRIYAYGDSSGDTAMLELAHEGFYRRF